jgi:hypothetical protein
LAEIFLMHSNERAVNIQAVVAVDDDGRFLSEARDVRADGNESGTPGSVEAKVLIEVVVIEGSDCRLENMRSGRGSGGHAPAPIFQEQRRLGLRASKAELPSKGFTKPRRGVFAEFFEALGNFLFGEPGDVAGPG